MNTSRRGFVLGVALATLGRARHARSAERMKRLGVVYLPSREVVESIKVEGDSLAALGWIEGRTLEKVKRYADFEPGRLEPLAREVVRERPDVILCSGVPATRAFRGATATIPICTIVDDPVGNGFAASFARPGGNITGLSEGSELAAAKEIQLVRSAVPAAARLAIVSSGLDPAYLRQNSRSLLAAAKAAGMVTEVRSIESRSDMEDTLRFVGPAGQGVIYAQRVSPDGAAAIAQAAAAKKVPVVGPDEALLDHGLLMTFRLVVADPLQLASMLDRLLRGANPATTPFELPSRSVFGINQKAAAMLGVSFPRHFFVSADRVVQ